MCSSGGGGRNRGPVVPVESPEQLAEKAEAARKAAEAEARRKAEEEAARRREEARIAAEQERQRQIQLGRTNIDDAFAGFNDSYYTNIDKQYEDYARTDIEDQYQKQLRGLVGALSGIDNLQYATRSQGVDDLGIQYRNALGMVDESGDSIADQARSEITSARDNLISTNANTANAEMMQQRAQEAAQNLAGRSRMSRLASLFVDPVQYAASRPGYGGRPAVFGTSNATGSSGGSSRIVG
jgi:hypothetical protein